MKSATAASNQLIPVPLTSLALHDSENSFEIHLVRGHEITYQVINSRGDFGFVLKVPNNYRSLELNMWVPGPSSVVPPSWGSVVVGGDMGCGNFANFSQVEKFLNPRYKKVAK